MSRFLAILAAVVAVVFLGWQYWLGTRTDEFAACGGGSVAGGTIGGAVALVDESGAPVTEADLFKKPALVYFGYSFCPDVCPLDNVRNAEATESRFQVISFPLIRRAIRPLSWLNTPIIFIPIWWV